MKSLTSVIVICYVICSVRAQVRIRPPSITAEPPAQFWFRGAESVTLQCSASGEPSPTFSWTMNGNPLDIDGTIITQPDPLQGTIVFPSAANSNQGFYQCQATNDYGTALSMVSYMEFATVSISANPSTITPLQTTQGEFLKVQCETDEVVVTSNPAPTHSWQLALSLEDTNPAPFATSQRVTMDPDGNLYFSNTVTADQQGTLLYLCNARNFVLATVVGVSYSKISVTSVTAQLSEPDIQYETPSPALGIVGSSITLFCIFSGFPTPSVTWGRVGGSMPADYTFQEFNTQVVINNLKLEDAGTYSCTGTNSVASNSESIDLTVEEIPYFEAGNGPDNINVTVGDDVTFRCNATGIPTPSEQWMMNGQELNSGSLPERMTLGDGGLSLTVSDLCRTGCTGTRTTDLMVIQCNASNVHGSSFGDGYLNVLLQTTLTNPPPATAPLIGFNILTLPCAGTSDPSTPVFADWYYGGAPVVYDPPYITQLDDGSLQIDTNDATNWEAFAGTYACNLTNGFSTDVAYVNVQLVGVGAAGTLAWWIYLLIAVAIIIIILLIAACVYISKNPGQGYLVDKNERKQGLDPEADCRSMDHVEHIRPTSVLSKPPANLLGLSSVETPYKYGESEQGSLNEYGDVSFGKFNEDGSFIGQYAPDQTPRGVVNPAMIPGDATSWRQY